jgi:FMN phosphatase YigB (HAD superfamily)
MLSYADLPSYKKAFIFELDNVLYPEKDYLLQVYYLFASFIEYTETFPPASDLTNFFKISYEHHGQEGIFEKAKKAFGLDERYRENFERLHKTARLPLKLLLFQNALKLLQDIIVDRKEIFIITNGDPEQQLNKIKQIEWNGLEKYLTVYFANELQPKPEIDVLTFILDKHKLSRRDLLILGNTKVDEEFAIAVGVDYLQVADIR